MRLFISKDSKYRTDGSSSPGWMKSSLSTHNGSCVEVRGLEEDTIRVRDSKHPRGAVLSFTLAEWDAFIGGVRLGEFDRQHRDQ